MFQPGADRDLCPQGFESRLRLARSHAAWSGYHGGMWSVEISLRVSATPENRRCRLDLFNVVKVGAKVGTKLGKAMSMRLEQNYYRH